MACVASRSRSDCRLHDRGWCSKRMVRVAVRWCVGSTCHFCALIGCRLFVVVPFLASLALSWVPAHPHIAAYADTATLLGDSAAQRSAFGQTRELLRTEHLQDFGFDLKAVGDVGLARG